MINFQNSYSTLNKQFYHHQKFNGFSRPQLIFFNDKLRQFLKLPTMTTQEKEFIFTGNTVVPGSIPICMAYAGHQFGHYVPQLGDGRATLLGEVNIPQGTFDIQLKGSGKTIYSRGGDGKCALGPALREYIISETMHSLGIETTRSLALNLTGEDIVREKHLAGAVLTRVAKSHIRVGTFEYFFYNNDFTNLKVLADYSIDRLFPQCNESKNKYLEFFIHVARKQIELICKWQSVGFIHGVMNTDNCNISGETIDYGPCAFMDHFHFEKTFSSIDYHRRYAYANQSKVVLWNLSALAQTLLPLVHSNIDKSSAMIEEVLEDLPNLQLNAWVNAFAKKFGILKPRLEDQHLIIEYLNFLQHNHLDFTNSFRELSNFFGNDVRNNDVRNKTLPEVILKIKKRIDIYNPIDCIALANSSNPYLIPRNHQVEKAIRNAYQGDFDHAKCLLAALSTPYQTNHNHHEFSLPPTPSEVVCQTFCGT